MTSIISTLSSKKDGRKSKLDGHDLMNNLSNMATHTSITLDYYNTHAESFSADTQLIDFSEHHKNFLHYIPKGGRILDLGCGAGRDSKAFLKAGYKVDAIDGSEKLCKIAEAYIGQPVTCVKFQDFNPLTSYDGIWACASLLHLNSDEIYELLQKLAKHLSPNGCIYASFKYGDFSGFVNGRFFQHMNESSLQHLVDAIPALHILETKITHDLRPERNNERWLNVLLLNKKF